MTGRNGRAVTVKLTPAQTVEYQIGYQHGMSAFYQAGHSRLMPSIAQRYDYAYCWSQYRAGWKKAQKDYYKW